MIRKIGNTLSSSALLAIAVALIGRPAIARAKPKEKSKALTEREEWNRKVDERKAQRKESHETQIR